MIIKMKICACVLRDNLDKNQRKNLTKKREGKVEGAWSDGFCHVCHVTVEEA